MQKALKLIGEQHKTYTQESSQLRQENKDVEAALAPKKFVNNLKTGTAHRVRLGISDVGGRAKTFCGWKYAAADIAMSSSPPSTYEECCGDCLPALKATLREYLVYEVSG